MFTWVLHFWTSTHITFVSLYFTRTPHRNSFTSLNRKLNFFSLLVCRGWQKQFHIYSLYFYLISISPVLLNLKFFFWHLLWAPCERNAIGRRPMILSVGILEGFGRECRRVQSLCFKDKQIFCFHIRSLHYASRLKFEFRLWNFQRPTQKGA